MRIPLILRIIFNRRFFQAVFSFCLLIFTFYFFESFFVMFFMTFLFAFLFYSLAETIYKILRHFINKISNKRVKNILLKIFSLNFIVILVYFGFLAIIAFAISNLVPKILKELSSLPQTLSFL